MVQTPDIDEVEEEVIKHVETQTGVIPSSTRQAKHADDERELVYRNVDADYDEFREKVESYNGDGGMTAIATGDGGPFLVHVLVESPPNGWSE